MIQNYFFKESTTLFIYTFLAIWVLSCLLIAVNFILNTSLKKYKTASDIKKINKRKETYELRVNSIRTINTTNTCQTLILALLFLLFNIKITLLIPMILSFQTLTIHKQAIVILYILFIMLSVYIKITSNIIIFYKNKKTKYII